MTELPRVCIMRTRMRPGRDLRTSHPDLIFKHSGKRYSVVILDYQADDIEELSDHVVELWTGRVLESSASLEEVLAALREDHCTISYVFGAFQSEAKEAMTSLLNRIRSLEYALSKVGITKIAQFRYDVDAICETPAMAFTVMQKLEEELHELESLDRRKYHANTRYCTDRVRQLVASEQQRGPIEQDESIQ